MKVSNIQSELPRKKIDHFLKPDMSELKGSLHRFEYRNFCVNVYTCISFVTPLIHVNLR